MEVTMLLKLGNKRLASRVPINWSLNHTTVVILSCFFETGSHTVQADFNFALFPRMIFKAWFSGLHLSSAGITSIYLHACEEFSSTVDAQACDLPFTWAQLLF